MARGLSRQVKDALMLGRRWQELLVATHPELAQVMMRGKSRSTVYRIERLVSKYHRGKRRQFSRPGSKRHSARWKTARLPVLA